MANATPIQSLKPTPETVHRLARACLDYVAALRDLDAFVVDAEVGGLIDLMDEEPSPWPERLDEIERRARALVATAPARSGTMTLTEAAVLLGINAGSAYRMVREERFPVPVVRVGRRIMVSRRRLEEVIGDSMR